MVKPSPFVTPTAKRPTHHITLSDGSNTVGLTVVDRAGNDDPLRIQRSPFPRTSTRIAQGENQYSDIELPYKPIVQDTWAGGRGSGEFEEDVSRFMESCRLNTTIENLAVLGGQETYSSGIADLNQEMPGDVIFWSLWSSNRFFSRLFTASASYDADSLFMWIKKVGTPGTLTFALYADSGGQPTGSALTSNTLTAASVDDVVSFLYGTNLSYSMTGSTDYHVVIYGAVTDTVTDHWEVGYDYSASGGNKSSDGSSWSSATGAPYFRLRENISGRGKFLFYKGAEYFLTQPLSGGASKLYVNGDRGCATGGASSTLTDSDKSWSTNEWAGCVLLLTKGTGATQERTWRLIASNTATQISTTGGAWDISPAAGTEYVIIGAEQWTLMHTFTYYVTDFAVAGSSIIFAQGESYNMVLYSEYANTTNDWVAAATDQRFKASHVKAIRDPASGTVIWGSRNTHPQHGVTAFKANVPQLMGTPPLDGQLYNVLGTLATNKKIWNESNNTGAMSVGEDGLQMTISTSVTGDVASLRLDPPVDISQGRRIAFMIKSDVASTGGTGLQLVLDDTQNLGDTFLADQVWHLDKETPAQEVVWFNGTDYIPATNLTDGRHDTSSTELALQTDDYLYIGLAQPFSTLKIAVLVANAVSSTFAAEYYFGNNTWAAVTITDGTESGGATLAQDGEITYTQSSRWHIGSDSDLAANISQDLYWLRLRPSANLTTTTRLAIINCEGAVDFLPARYVSLNQAKDGRDDTYNEIDFSADDYLYVMYPSRYNKIKLALEGTVNATASTMSAQYFDGEVFAPLTIISDGTVLSGATMGQSGSISFNMPQDWEPITISSETGYVVRLSPNVDLDKSIDIIEVAVTNDDRQVANIPALTANQWHWVECDYDDTPGAFNMDYGNIVSVGLRRNVDYGNQTIYIGSDLYIVDEYPAYIPLGDSEERITEIESYGIERENPWYFKEGSLYEIQTENDDNAVQLCLKEIGALRSNLLGKAHTTSDVYLMFNIDERIERLYQNQLDDIGPNRDEGLPSDRQGTISALVSAPGKVYAAVDAGSGGYSSVLVREGGGWHEVYRAPSGERIWDLSVQIVYGELSRLWVAQGDDILWVPIPRSTDNPLHDSDYNYIHEGQFTTGWISANFLDLVKLFSTIKLYTENLSSGNQEIQVEYQTESGELDSGWTTVVLPHTTSPFEEISLSASNDVTARRIRLRMRFTTNDASVTPVLKAWVLETLIRFTVKYQWVLPVRIEDDPKASTMGPDYMRDAEDKVSQLDTWATAPSALTLRTMFSAMDNYTVVFEPMGMRPFHVDPVAGKEGHYAELRLLEI